MLPQFLSWSCEDDDLHEISFTGLGLSRLAGGSGTGGTIKMSAEEEDAVGIQAEARLGGSESIKRLLSWAEDNGATIDGVALRHCRPESQAPAEEEPSTTAGAGIDEGGEGGGENLVSVFFATRDLEAKDVLFRIPSTVFLCARSEGKWRSELETLADRDECFGRDYRRLSERDKLSLRLLMEYCDDESHWQPYVSALPRDDPCLSSWDPSSLKHLEHTPIWKSTKGFSCNLDILGDPSADLVSAADRVASSLGCASFREKCTRTAVRWCHKMVMSRAFGIRFDHMVDPCPTLVPVVDLLDHSNQAKVSWAVTEGDSRFFRFALDKTLAEGALLYTNYGGKGNEELLRGYGFALHDNPHDFYVIELGVGGQEAYEGDPTAWSLRIDLLERMRCKKTHALTLTDPLPSALVAAATLCILPQSQVYRLFVLTTPSEGAGNGDGGTGSGGNRLEDWLTWDEIRPHCLRAHEMLLHQVRSVLDKLCHVSSIEDDEALAVSELRFRPLVALRYRLGLKRILRASREKLAERVSAMALQAREAPQPSHPRPPREGSEFFAEDHEALVLDVNETGSDSGIGYKTKLMAAACLPRLHYFSAEPIGSDGVWLLLDCVALRAMKEEKSRCKLHSDEVLAHFDASREASARLADRMHHYQTPLPVTEKKVRDAERDFQQAKTSFLRKLRKSASHPQILKKAAVLLEKARKTASAPESSHIEESANTLLLGLREAAARAKCLDHFDKALGEEKASRKKQKV